MIRPTRLFFFFLIVTASIHLGQNITSQTEELLKISELDHAQWSGYAINITKDQILFNKNENFSLAPASGQKVVTTSAGLELLGAEFNFKTQIAYSGKIDKSGILEGDILIIGGGDPTLGSDRVKGSLNLPELYKVLVDMVKKAGINSIRGNIIAYDGYLGNETTPDNWFWVDMGNYYGAFASGLTIHDNLYYLYFKPALKVGEAAEVLRTEPVIPNLKFTNYMKTGKKGSGDNGYIYCAPFQNTATLRGSIPARVEEFAIKGSIPDPGYFAAEYFRISLENAGIKVSGNVKTSASIPTDYKNIYTHVSPPLKDIVYYINKVSFNLYTEHVLRAIAKKYGDAPTTSEGVNLVKKFLHDKGIDDSGVALYDGCGLSRSNMITTKMMCELLKYMANSKNYEHLNNSLALAGDPDDIGYYSNLGIGTKLEKNARIKSGLIERVRSFSGYLRNDSGDLISFSFIANNYEGSRRAIDKLHTDIMIKLAETK